MKQKILYLILSIAILPQISLGQYYFRVKADVTIKEKGYNDEYKLVIGQVYYDIHHKKIVYNITFPEKEQWLLIDTSIYYFKNDKLINRQLSPVFPELSVFHLVLQGGLEDYGLGSHPLIKVKEIDKTPERIVKTLGPVPEHADKMGLIKIATKDRKLEGILFYNLEGRLMSRQFFAKYKVIKGLEFPTEIVQYLYPLPREGVEVKGDSEILIQTTFSNIQINRTDEEFMYNFPVPLD
jgi:hypothetical protein